MGAYSAFRVKERFTDEIASALIANGSTVSRYIGRTVGATGTAAVYIVYWLAMVAHMVEVVPANEAAFPAVVDLGVSNSQCMT